MQIVLVLLAQVSLVVLTALKNDLQQYVFPETVFPLLRIIHRPHCQQFSVELLAAEKIVP